MNRRPNPARSREETRAPIATPPPTAAAQTRRIVDGSPAWNPQATFALVITPSSASSSPSVQTPKPSPRSALTSMVATVRPPCSDKAGPDEALAGDQAGQLHLGQVLGADWPARQDHVARLGAGVPHGD